MTEYEEKFSSMGNPIYKYIIRDRIRLIADVFKLHKKQALREWPLSKGFF